MQPSKKCYDLIKDIEKFEVKAYKDPGSKDGLPITIGYGSTMRMDGTKFKMGDTITLDEAEKLFEWSVNKRAVVIDSILLGVSINQNQFDALVSLVYNIGIAAFEKSTLLKKIKINPNNETIPFEFSRWNKNDGKVMNGLTIRRKKEADLYIS